MSKQSFTNRNAWQRGLFMLLFAFLLWLAKFVVLSVAAIQFLTVLISGERNDNLVYFGQCLSRYHYQIVLFLTYNSDFQPFPIGEWPKE